MSENENSALGKCCYWVFGVQVPFPFFLIPGTHRRIIALQVVLVVKSPPENSGDIRDAGSIPGSGRPPGEGHDNQQYSCLENSMDRGAWRSMVHRVTESDTTEGMECTQKDNAAFS